MTTKLGRWCLRTSEIYGNKCKPEVKQLQNIYDHGFTTMDPKYFSRKNEKIKVEERKSLFSRLWGFVNIK